MHVVMENYNRLNWSGSMYIYNLPVTDTRLSHYMNLKPVLMVHVYIIYTIDVCAISDYKYGSVGKSEYLCKPTCPSCSRQRYINQVVGYVQSWAFEQLTLGYSST